MTFEKSHYSLTVSEPLRLIYDDSITLVSNNPHIKTKGGMIYAAKDQLRASSRATITAMNSEGETLDTCGVTIVNWKANSITLEDVEVTPYGIGMIEADGILYAYEGNELYKTTDSFQTREFVGTSNIQPYRILKTPFGYYAREIGMAGTKQSVYKSTDLFNWTLAFEPAHRGLYHMFDFHYDGTNVYIYLGEYTADDSTRRHKVYRGIIEPTGTETWSTVIDFYSVAEHTADPVNNTPSARHIHVVQVDPYTGHVYVNTGDANPQSQHMISTDNGDNWRQLGVGTQEWRALSYWFTEEYVYYNMDTSSPQYIFRIKRENIPLQTPSTDYRERVAFLNQGSMWYHCWIKDDNGDDAIIMGQAAEGQIRDARGRLFYIKETNDGADVREIHSIESRLSPAVMVQLEPILQDKNGYIYLNGRDVEPMGVRKMKLGREYHPVKHKFLVPTVFSSK